MARNEGGGGGGGGGAGGAFSGEAHSLKSGPPAAAAAAAAAAAPAAPAAAPSSAGRALGDLRALSLASAGDPLFTLPAAQPLRPPPMSAGALLAALPERVLSANGTLLAVRGAVGAALGVAGDGAPAAAPALTPSPTPITPGDPAAAHIKVRFDGAQNATRVFLLHADLDTVGTLLSVVASQRAGTGPFELRSAAQPRTAFSLRAPAEQLRVTLRAAGFAPSAALFVRALEA